MAKRKLDLNDSYQDNVVLTGYLHNVSTLMTSSSGTTKYFTASLQTTKNDCNRVVSFCPEKHEDFLRAASMNSAMKLVNPKLKPSSEGKLEVHIVRQTSLEMSHEKLPFTKLDKVSTGFDEAAEIKLAQVDKESMRVTIKVKVLGFLGEEKDTPTKYGMKSTREAVVADESGTLRITFWGKTIQEVRQKGSYKISNLTSRIFNGTMTLNTSQSTKIEEISEIQNASDQLSFLQDVEENVLIDQIKVVQNYKKINSKI